MRDYPRRVIENDESLPPRFTTFPRINREGGRIRKRSAKLACVLELEPITDFQDSYFPSFPSLTLVFIFKKVETSSTFDRNETS